MGDIIGKCAKKTNEVHIVEKWPRRQRTEAGHLDEDEPTKNNSNAKAKAKAKEDDSGSEFHEEPFLSTTTSSSMSSEGLTSHALRQNHVSQHPPPPRLQILTEEAEKADQRWYTKTVWLDAGVHCWLWVDEEKAAMLFKSGDRRLISIARRCNCLIELGSNQRYHIHKGLQRRIDIYAHDDRSLTKCLNLLEETFWSFRLRNLTFP
ncbi:unnamed protein product [Hydatigera taeniaeformis]|uniref:SH2 domain-containing protein n=1 Tax=Hydatigena taeniaeformis TaxID=6205 RepID=A0A0R3WJC8_HYDTA|nr:unnamed protein product [Hydatigera taeniaeformis]